MTKLIKSRIAAIALASVVMLTSTFVLAPAQVSAASNVKIGQATSDENGKTRGGAAGDQKGSEVGTTSWTYNSKSGVYNNWKYVFRAKDPVIAQRLAQLMLDACNNNHIGYDQQAPDRFSLYDQAKSNGWNIAGITTDCETTCTSVVSVCLNAVGISAPRYWDASLVYKDLSATGKFTVFTDSAHCSSDAKLEPGDILVSPGKHTAMVVKSPNSAGRESVVVAATGPSTLCAEGVRQPGTILKGNGFSIAGTVQSNYIITSVTVSVINSSGSEVIKESAQPNNISFRIGALDSDVKFGSLPAGHYIYRITAADTKKGATVVHENGFDIVTEEPSDTSQAENSASTLSAKDLSQPGTLTQGSGFYVKGTITSNKTISSVKAVILNSSNKSVISASASPYSTSFSMTKLDSSLKFGTLGAGTYRYVITAVDNVQTLVLLDKTFTVVKAATPAASAAPAVTAAAAPKVSTPSITISSVRAPSVIRKGKSFTFWGTINSVKKIKYVRVQVLNSKGKVKLSASKTVNKYTYNIKKLDKKIKFRKLGKGTYTFRVRVKTSAGWQTLFSQKFTVN